MSTRVDRTILGPNDDGRRLDRIVRKYLPDVPLSRIYRALRSREIAVNGTRARADTRVHEGDVLEIAETLRGARVRRDDGARTSEAVARLSGRIVFEDDDLLVVAKRCGELTHGPGSLEELVRAYLADRIAAGISFRPGPIHRLDRNTSGLVVFGVSLRGARAATDAFAHGRVVKRYVALLEGHVRQARWDDLLERDGTTRTTRGADTTADAAHDAQRAITAVEPIIADRDATLALVRIDTGRTHQIRAQAAIHGHPLVGDRKYGGRGRSGYALHAASLTATKAPGIGFDHLWCPLPEPLKTRIERVFGPGAPDMVVRLVSGPAR